MVQMQRLDRIRTRLAASLEKQRELLDAFEGLLKDPEADAAAIDQAQRQLHRMAAEHTQLLTQWRLARAHVAEPPLLYAGFVGQRPMREQVLDILEELGVPASPRVISEISVACYGRPLPASRFASLRRDEERAFRKDSLSRPAWVVPAITAQGLTAIPRIVASSAWPAERRLIGARTLRANHLRILLALLLMHERAQRTGTAPATAHLESMILSFAQTVPGAVGPGERPDRARLAEAARAELAHIEKTDLEERQEAARRLERLPEPHRLWGRPAVIQRRRARGTARLRAERLRPVNESR
jgi:hypothetical protein